MAVTIPAMGKPGRYALTQYVQEIRGSVEAEEESHGEVLSPERLRSVLERLRDLDEARQQAEADSRDYLLS